MTERSSLRMRGGMPGPDIEPSSPITTISLSEKHRRCCRVPANLIRYSAKSSESSGAATIEEKRMTIETKNFRFGDYTALIEIYQDQDAQCPNEWNEEAQVFRAHDGAELRKMLEDEFGEDWEKAGAALVAGRMLSVKRDRYFGIEEYRHSGSAFALCREKGNFPDRQWDVIDLVGFVRIKAKEGDDEASLVSQAKSVLGGYQAWANGECYGYDLVVSHIGGREVEEDSCGGFIGSLRHCMEAALDALEGLAKDLCQDCELEEI